MRPRYLGVDPGTKRIGLAIADPESGVVSPLRVIAAAGTPAADARAILTVADEFAAEAVVIGLPLNMDDSIGPQAKLAQQLADALRTQTRLPVHLHDERLTSHAADHRLADRNLSRDQRRARHDAVAAAVLLESFLQRQSESRDGP